MYVMNLKIFKKNYELYNEFIYILFFLNNFSCYIFSMWFIINVYYLFFSSKMYMDICDKDFKLI